MKKILLFLFVLSSFLVKSQSQDTVLTGGGLYLYTDNTFTTILAIHQNIYITPPSAPICLGSSTTLTAQNSSTYTWSTGATTSTISVSPIVNTTYTVTGINNGYKSTSQAVVSVLPVTLTATSNSICLGSSGTLTASGGTAYTWNIGSNSSVIVIAPTTTTAYSISGLDMNGCIATATATMTVNPLPTITVNSVTISSGSATLTASGGSTYVWSNGSSGSSITISPTVTTSYIVTGTNSSGCTGTARGVVTVSGGVIPTSGLTMWLKADAGVKASGGYVYEWDDQSPIGTNKAVQSTGAYQPSYVSNYVNGYPALLFNGTSDYMTPPLNFGINQSGYSIFVVGKATYIGNYPMFFGQNYSTNTMLFYRNLGTMKYFYVNASSNGSTNEINSDLNWHILSLYRTNPTNYAYYDNTLVTMSDVVGTGAFKQLFIGAGGGGGNLLTGYVSEIIAYNYELSSGDRTTVINYLKAKYGTP